MRLNKLSKGLSESEDVEHEHDDLEPEYKDYDGPIKIITDISELSTSDIQALTTVSPAHLINVHETDGIFVPFIYIGKRPQHMFDNAAMMASKERDKLFVGGHKEYHDALVKRVKGEPSDKLRWSMGQDLEDLYWIARSGAELKSEDPTGTVGRYAKLFDASYWFGASYLSIFLFEIVAMYPSFASTQDEIKATLTKLVEEHNVSPNAFFVMGKQFTTIKNVLGDVTPSLESDDESIRLGKLQIALHLNRDEYGRPLDQAARRRIQQELGLAPEEDSDEDPVDREHPWSRAMKNMANKDKLVPGQKWWAPTSEDIQSGAILEDEDEVDLSWLSGEPESNITPEKSSYNKIVDGMEGRDESDEDFLQSYSYLDEIPPEPKVLEKVPLNLDDLTPEDKRMLGQIDPGYLADRAGSRPFLYYIDPETNKSHLFVGNEYEYHAEVIGTIRHQPHLFSLDTETGNKLADKVEEMWHNVSDANLTNQLGAVGRIAEEYSFVSHRDTGHIRLVTPQLVTTYSSRSATPEVISNMLRELIERGYITQNSLYIGNEQYCLVSDAIAGKVGEANDETIRKSKLQIALHLGKDEYGRPLDQAARRRIQQELGLTPEEGEDPQDRGHPWSIAMKKAGKLNPGQKWWAQTSEELNRKLDPIFENMENITDYTREELQTINPGRCITDSDSWPFIYFDNKLHVGKEGRYHSDLYEYGSWGPDNEEDEYDDVDPLQMFYESVANDDYSYYDAHGIVPTGTVGRVCNNYETVFGIIPSLVTIYSSKTATPEAVQETLKSLLKKKLITLESLYIGNKQVAPVSEVLALGSNEADEESIRLGKLQIALHLGKDEYGRPLNQASRRRIQKELGLTPDEDEDPIDRGHPWPIAMKKAGKLNPGQKWWAPTSEDINNYKKKLAILLEKELS